MRKLSLLTIKKPDKGSVELIFNSFFIIVVIILLPASLNLENPEKHKDQRKASLVTEVMEDEFTEEADDKRDDFNFQEYSNDETPSYKTQSNNFSKGQEEHQKPLSFGESLSERLLKQIDLKIKNEKQYDWGFDLRKNTTGNMYEMGIIDPKKVVRCALENAASASAMLLSAGSSLIDVGKN